MSIFNINDKLTQYKINWMTTDNPKKFNYKPGEEI
jgi:hypothetical protein